MDAKSVWLSKIFWFNVLALIVLVANAFGFVDFQHDPVVDQYALIIITLVNIALRLVTKQQVKL